MMENFSRRHFIKAAGLGAAALSLPGAARGAGAARRPNILWIVADDHAAWVTGAYGNKQIRTPNLDSLAAAGIRFDRAFCNSPVCTASRGSYMTGRYPRTIGVTQLPTPLPESETTLAELLGAAGYDTALIGKTHFNSALSHGFGRLADLREYQQWRAGRNSPPIPETIECYPGRGVERPAGGLFDPKTTAQNWNARCLPHPVRDEDSDGTFLAGQAAEYIKSHRENPFFLMVSFHQPHMPFQFPIEYAGKYRPEDFTAPEPGPEDDWQIPALFRDLTDAQRRGIAAAYYTATEYMDAKVGQVLEALERGGQADNTMVVYIGDNGYLLGQHGRFEKHCCYHEAVRQPLFIRMPGRVAPGRTSDALVEYLDIMPTVLDACGVATPANVQGRSLAGLLDGKTERHRDHVFVEYAINDEAMVFDGRWKLIYERGMRRRTEGYDPGLPLPGPTVRLFDLQNDPGEITNLARREDCRRQTGRLVALLAATLKRTERQPELLPKTEDPLAIIAHCVQPRDIEGPPRPARKAVKAKGRRQD